MIYSTHQLMWFFFMSRPFQAVSKKADWSMDHPISEYVVHGPVVHGPPYLWIGDPWNTLPMVSANTWAFIIIWSNHKIDFYARIARWQYQLIRNNLQSYVRLILVHSHRRFQYSRQILYTTIWILGLVTNDAIQKSVTCGKGKFLK
jgi:hypothetical protein